jgi:DNA-binding transcriptional LysR family regulator
MSEIHFRTLDLNLFRVLLALLERRSVTAAAADLALTPSAVSHALRRLRETLGDPLFARRGGALVPTAYALDVGRRAAPALEALRGATAPAEFAPSRAERQFVLTGGSYAPAVILPPLLNRLRAEAPRVRIQYVPLAPDFVEAVEQGRVDIAFGPIGLVGKRLEGRLITRDDMVWVARRRHPLVRAPLTMEMLQSVQHVVMDRFRAVFGEEYPEARRFLDEGAELRTAYDEALDPQTGRAIAIVSDMAHALAIVAGSDAVMLTMRRFAEALSPDRLEIFEPPHPTPTLEVGAIYQAGADPGVRWLLDQFTLPAR